MANIMGLQLKGYKSFVGMDGYGYNANLYYNNKKVAFCLDEGGGGEPSIQWKDRKNRKLIEEVCGVANKYFKKYPKHLFHISDEGKVLELVEELLRLMGIEKWYKNVSKKGYPVVVDIRYNKRTATIEEYDFHKKDIQTCYQVWDDKIEQAMEKKYNPVEYTVYKSLEDFNLN